MYGYFLTTLVSISTILNQCLMIGALKAADKQIAHNSSHILEEENQARGKLSALDNTTFIIALLFLTLHSFSQMQELNLGSDCQWRYHNYSILNYDPHPSGEFLSFHFALTSPSFCQSGQ